MIVKTRIFELCNGIYGNLSELSHAMGISVSQIYRVREGKRGINQKFIVGAVKAFPEYRLSDLFYLAHESQVATNTRHYETSTYSTDKQAVKIGAKIRKQSASIEKVRSPA